MANFRSVGWFWGVPHSTKASFWLSPRSAWSLPHCFRNQHLVKKGGQWRASGEHWKQELTFKNYVSDSCWVQRESSKNLKVIIKTGRDLQDFAGLRRISALWDVCRVLAGPRGGQEAAKVWCLQWGHGKSWQDQCDLTDLERSDPPELN